MTGGLIIVGAGNMGGAMVRRWVESGAVAPEVVTVVDHGRPALPDGVHHVSDCAEVEGRGDTVVLAVKPQQLAEVAGSVASLEPALLVSILAGVTHAGLAVCGAGTTLRAMPNMPVAIGRGVVALHGVLSRGQREQIDALMTPLGLVEWIDDEALFDAVTALSGCGPAFTCRFVDALAKAGAALGLPLDQAMRLATATVEGSAVALRQSGESAAAMADRVASPGGSTREGLNVLDSDGALDQLLAETLAAAFKRNRELARPL